MPGTRNPNVFEPPSAQQVARRLEENPPAVAGTWQTRLPLMIMAGLGLALLVAGSPSMALLPWLGLMGLLVYLTSRAKAARDLQQRVMRAWELAMIRRYREAMGQAWDLIPACRNKPELHGRVVTVMAHVLGELRCDEAAEVAYGYLLDRLPADHPLSLRLRVQRAFAALRADRLADADDALRKLRAPAEASKDRSVAALYEMARLAQDAQTGHFADAVAKAEDTGNALRPLGIEAGYGYGLLALCHHQLATYGQGAEPEKQKLAERSRRWWDMATLLIPSSSLIHRHPELARLEQGIGLHPDATDQGGEE